MFILSLWCLGTWAAWDHSTNMNICSGHRLPAVIFRELSRISCSYFNNVMELGDPFHCSGIL